MSILEYFSLYDLLMNISTIVCLVMVQTGSWGIFFPAVMVPQRIPMTFATHVCTRMTAGKDVNVALE